MSDVVIISNDTQSIEAYQELSTDEQVIRMWLHGRSTNTQRAYRQAAARFVQFVDKPLQHVTLPEAQAFADSLHNLAPATQSVTVAAIRSLFKFAKEIGYLQVDVTRPLHLPKYEHKVAERILDKGEVQAMIEAEVNHRNRIILLLLYYGALRVSELSNLEWRNIRQGKDGGIVTVFGKGGKTRSVMIPQDVYDQIVTLKPAGAALNEPIFSSSWLDKRTTTWNVKPRRIEYMVRKAAERVGIDRPVSPHWLRHSHATHALEAGAPIHLVSKTLGHASLATTEVYLHVRPDTSSATYLSFDEL